MRHSLIRHWSRPASAGVLGCLLAFFSLGLVGQPVRVWGPCFAVIALVEAMCVRGLMCGAAYSKRALLIRDPIRTSSLEWEDIRGFEIDPTARGQMVVAVMNDGKKVKVWGTDAGGGFTASPGWLANAVLDLRRWQDEATRANR